MELLRQARQDHDVLFEDLLAFQMQRFLPGGADESTLGDTVGATIRSFRDWLRNRRARTATWTSGWKWPTT